MREFFKGVKRSIPVMLGYIPVGIAFAILAKQAGLSTIQTCLMSLGVYAGASQIMAVGMMKQGALLSLIVLTTFILNLRHIIMSTCVMKDLKKSPLYQRLIASFGVTDETFSVFTTQVEKPSYSLFLGLMLGSYASWNVGTLLGALFSDFLPSIVRDSLDIALYALFIALLVPGLIGNKKRCLLVLLTIGINTVVSRWLSSSSAIIVSTLGCAAIGTIWMQKAEKEEFDGS